MERVQGFEHPAQLSLVADLPDEGGDRFATIPRLAGYGHTGDPVGVRRFEITFDDDAIRSGSREIDVERPGVLVRCFHVRFDRPPAAGR